MMRLGSPLEMEAAVPTKTLAEMQAVRRAQAKPTQAPKAKGSRRKKGPTARSRAARRRKERPVVDLVRDKAVARDGHCRASLLGSIRDHGLLGFHVCDGPSEMAHLRGHTKAETRGMKPEERHHTQWVVMLCRKGHDQYDGRRRPRIEITESTEAGADGALLFKETK
jgi:hypothetical protein